MENIPELLGRVRERAAREPRRPAVSWPGGGLDQAGVIAVADGLAERLLAADVGEGDVVALTSDLPAAAVPGLLACWSIGATPWPFDPASPSTRLASMVGDACPAAVVLPAGADFILAPGVPQLALNLDEQPTPLGWAASVREPNAAAYLLFTSGSSGEPKGVLMPMDGLVRLVRWQATQQGPGAIGQFAPRTFDVAFQEIATALWTGSELVVLSAEERHDPLLMGRRLEKAGVETLFLPTAALHACCEALRDVPLDGLRRIIVAGEQLRVSGPVRGFFAKHPRCELHNQYGPTETHVVTAHVLTGPAEEWPDLPPVGESLPDVMLEVTAAGQPLADGQVGELLVRGPRVARGYFRAGVVAESGGFARDKDGLRYATGDLVRRGPDGFHYVARADAQVKIRGHRVEVGEVEAVIERHPDGLRCAVAAVDRGSHHDLVAYLVTGDPVDDPTGVVRVTHRSLESWCRLHLTEPMVPSVWLRVAALPLTAHGKVDRRALPEPPRSRPQEATRYVTPATPVEASVAAIWSRVLGIDEVGVLDEFSVLGGTSLQAMRILSALRAELASDLRAVDVHSHPTVRGFCEAIDGRAPRALDRPARTNVTSGRIAIVGMACRFPGADDADRFWENLLCGVESIHREVKGHDRPGFVAAAGRIANVDRFDAAYFGMSDLDAARTDPQQRILLELAVTAFEDAGVPSASRRQTGVFVGCGPSTYLLNNLLPGMRARPERNFIDSIEELELLLGNDKDYAATRIAYALDLHGPAYTVTAACATGLVAVDAARRALLSGSCDYALAGAVSVSAPDVRGYEYEPGLMYSPDGVCRAFAADASGTVFSSGGGVIVLRRVEDAVAAGDQIYAVVEGSAVGNDGRRKLGMTAPSAAGQAEVVRRAWVESELDSSSLRMVEGHGTATRVGDAIEVSALRSALGTSLPEHGCAIGSVKSNIGHLGWASGIAGIIKASLAISHRCIPPTLHCATPAEAITESGSPFYSPSAPSVWPEGQLAVAAVSSFGLGGANAHVVLSGAGADGVAGEPPSNPAVVYPLSARSATALSALAAATIGTLDAARGPAARLATTAGRHRDHHPWRMAVVGTTPTGLADGIRRAAVPTAPSTPPQVAFLFAGQGFDHVGMGRSLTHLSEAFRDAIADLAKPFRDAVGADLHNVLGLDGFDPTGGTPALTSIAVAQPAIYCFQLALVDLWADLGVKPDVVLGHSLGEFAAAATAGVFDREDGLLIVAERGRLLATLPDGVGMLAVRASAIAVEVLIAERSLRIEIAAVNGPRSVAVAGTEADLAEFETAADAEGIEVTRLAIQRAGHSSHMDPIVEHFGKAFDGVATSPPQLTLLSNVTGVPAGAEVCSAQYWQRHLRQPVRFADGVTAAVGAGVRLFLEISGHPTLAPLVAQVADDPSISAVPSLDRREDEAHAIATAVATIYEAGTDVAWDRCWWSAAGRSSVPTYRFDRARHWSGPPPHPLPGRVTPAAATWLRHVVEPDRRLRRWLLVGADGALRDELAGRGHRADTSAATDLALVRVSDFDEIVVRVTPGATSAATLEPAIRAVLGAVRIAPTGARLTIVSAGCYQVPGHAGSDTWADAAVIGIVRVCATEGAAAQLRQLDVTEQTRTATLADALEDSAGTELAHRGDAWLRPSWRPVSLPVEPPAVPHDGVQLVIGGTRGLGLWTAEQLVARGARRVLVAGRGAPLAAAAVRLDALRARGSDVEVLTLDVADPDAPGVLNRALGQTPLACVVFAAGVIDDALLADLNWSRVHSVLRTKIDGFRTVVRLLESRSGPPPRVLVYSSVAATLGNAGQAAHAAANEALNAAVAMLEARGVPATSIGWGPWSDEGFLADRPELGEQLSRAGLAPITGRVAAGLLDGLLAAPVAHVDLLTVDWPSYAATLPGSLPGRLAELSRDPGDAGASATQVNSSANGRAVVKAAVARHLGREPDGHRSLTQEGFDSLGILRLRNEITRTLGVRVTSAELTAAPTLDNLVDQVEARRDLPAGAVADLRAAGRLRSTAAASGSEVASFQQQRWRSLVVGVGYGHRVVPIFLSTALDPARLRRALVQVVARHDALRSVHTEPGKVRFVGAESAVPALADLVPMAGPTADPRTAIKAAIRMLRAAPSDVTRKVSWTCLALETAPHAFVLLLSLQHLDFDGTSLSVFVDELSAEYAGAGVTAAAPAYHEYTAWQRDQWDRGSAEARAYLQGLYSQISAPTILPGRTSLATTVAPSSTRYTPDPSAYLPVSELTATASGLGVSLFALVAAAFGRAVAALYELDEMCVTAVFGGRTEERFERLVGPVTSHWPLPISVGSKPLPVAAQIVARAAAQLGEFASWCSPDAILAASPAFAGLPADSYFSDVALNFTSYQRQRKVAGPAAEVVEVLGPVDHPLLDPADFGGLTYPAGLHLIFDVSGAWARPSLWFHTGRFTETAAAEVITTTTAALRRVGRAGE